MKKKLLSWIMIFAMLLTLLPETAFAAENPSFGFRCPGLDEETDEHYEDLEAPLEFKLTSDGYGGCPVFFYFTDEHGVEHRLSGEDVSSSDENIVTLWENDQIPGLFHIDFIGLGDAQINYTYNDTVYSIPVTVDIPSLGFYTAPSATVENYAPEHLVTAENTTLYILLRDDFQDSYHITNVTLDYDFASIAELVSIDESGAFATIEITGIPIDDFYYGAEVEVIVPETGETGSEWTGLALYNGYPALKFRWSDWNDGPVENTDSSFSTNYQNTPNCGDYLFFYYTENGNETRLSAEDLVSSDEGIVTISAAEENPDCILVEMTGLGSATIDYTLDGVTYSVPVYCELPNLGFYSEPTASAETLITNFTVSKSQDTFYLVAKDSWTIFNVELNANFQEIATITLDESSKFATIKVTGTPNSDFWYCVYFDAENAETDEYWSECAETIYLENGKPSLVYRWPDWQGRPEENLESPVSHHYSNAPGNTNPLFFYYKDGDTEIRLSAEDLVSSDESVVTVSVAEENPDSVLVELTGFGSATIDYTLDDVTYSLPVVSELPTFGFYSSPEANEETYLSEFTITEDCDTFYLVATNGWKLENVSLRDQFNDIATFTLNEDRTCAAIKVTGSPDNNRWYTVDFDAFHEEHDDHTTDNSYGLKLFNNKPSLMMRDADWNNGPTENLEYELQNFYRNAPGYDNAQFFYFVADGEETRLHASDLTSSDESVVQVSEHPENEDAVMINIVGFGNATIDYTINDTTYSLNVTGILPDTAFSTAPVLSEDSYTREFTVTDDNNIIYLTAKEGWEITYTSLKEDFADIASISLDESGTYAAIEITGTPENNRWYELEFSSYCEEYDNYNQRDISIRLFNGKPSLMFRYPDWNDIPVENTNANLHSFGSSTPGSSECLFFYFIADGEETRLNISDLTVSDEDILRIYADQENENAVRVDALDFGNATVDYTVNGKTYSVTFDVTLPPIGLYSSRNASEETYISKFTITETSDTFYLVARDGWELSNVQLVDDLNDIATLTLSEDATWAAIQVTGTPRNDRWYNVRLDAYNPIHDNSMTDNSYGIRLMNGKPSLMVRDADWNDGPTENPEYELRNFYQNSPGNANTMFFYFVADGEETKLRASDLTSSDQSIVKVSEHPQNPDAVLIETIGFGNATIDYTINDVTYSLNVTCVLPNVAFSTTPVLSEDSYIRKFTVTEDCSTFYLAANEGWEITYADLIGDFADIASISLDESGTYATIEITGTPEKDRWYELELGIYHAESNNYNSFSANIQLSSTKPALMFDREGDLITTYENCKGANMDFAFYLIENGTQTLVTAKDLVSGNEDILKISECPFDKNLVNLVLVGWGETTIDYTNENGKTYSVKVISELPPVGYYGSPAATEDTFIGQEFTLTDTTNTYYLISINNWTFDTFSPDEALKDIAEFELSSDRKILRISITGDPAESMWYHIVINNTSYYGITIVDGRTVTEQPPVTELFTDVEEGAWYADEIQYVYDKGIMTGTGETTFEPDLGVTRATIVQTLYKLEGKPAVGDFTKYDSLDDTLDSIWWRNGLAWALNEGVAKGDSKNNVFNPDNLVTREDLATFIYRYAQYKGVDVELEGSVDEILRDTFVNSWSRTAFAWAIETGLIKGKTINGVSELAPQVGATRAELATIMMRFYETNDL